MGKTYAKGIILASVFMNCFSPRREMTVKELLEMDKHLNACYRNSPHVLSNALRRYTGQNLLYRRQGFTRGHPFYYGMTEKGFNRFQWMLLNARDKYFPYDRVFLELLLTKLIFVLNQRKLDEAVKILRKLQSSPI